MSYIHVPSCSLFKRRTSTASETSNWCSSEVSVMIENLIFLHDFLCWLFHSSTFSFNFYLQTLRYRHCWSLQYAGRASYELRNRPRSPWSLCGSVVEHRSAESAGLRFDSSWGLRIFSLSHARDKTKNIFLHPSNGANDNFLFNMCNVTTATLFETSSFSALWVRACWKQERR